MNYLKLGITSICLLGITAIVSCKKEDDKKTTPKETCTNNGYLKFLNVGNKWNYSYWEFSSSEDTFISYSISSQTSAGSYKFDISGGGTLAGAYKTRYIKECNDWMLVNTSNDPTNADDKSYPAIRKTGDKWTVGTTNNYTVVETGVSVTTPAGTFKCDKIAYAQTGAFNVDTIFYSNDIGWIKYDGWFMGYELTSKNF